MRGAKFTPITALLLAIVINKAGPAGACNTDEALTATRGLGPMAAEMNSSPTPPTSGRWFVDPETRGPERARWILADAEGGTRYLLAAVYSHEPATADGAQPAGHRDANAELMARSKDLAAALRQLYEAWHGEAWVVMNDRQRTATLNARMLLRGLAPLTGIALQGEI